MRFVRHLTAAFLLAGVGLIPMGAGASVPAQQSFTVTGEVDGLFPGSSAALPVLITNPQAFAIHVTSSGVTVGDANPACPATLLTVDGATTMSGDVAPGATATIPLVIQVDRATPDACQGATWQLQFLATATDTGAGAATSAAGPSRSSLAFTGTTISALVGVALALVLVGAAIRRAVRRRARWSAP